MNLGIAYRVREGDLLQLRTVSSNAVTLTASMSMLTDEGEDIDLPTLSQTTASDRTVTATNSAPITQSGWVTSLSVEGDTGVKRGQIYCKVQSLHRSTLRPRNYYFAGYVYDEFRAALGFFEESLSGKGYLDWVQESDDIAGNATVMVNLATSNARRVVRAILVKYHSSSDVASRTLTITLRDLASATGPTGWSNDSDTWISPTLTLTADEEGLIHVGEHGFVSTNDDGTLAYADNSSSPNPFPLAVEEGDAADLIIAAGAGEAADDFDVWVQYEEWLEV